MIDNNSKKKSVLFSHDIVHIKTTILGSVTENIIKKIILFGSYAYGKPNKNSDIDLCVIVADQKNSRDAYFNIALALFNRKITLTDLLVYKEKDFTSGIQKNERGIESVINSSGKVLYAQD